MKAGVDDERCRGHGVCESLCPEVFVLNDDGYAEVQVAEIPAGSAAAAAEAAANCPEHAITVS